MGEAKRRREAGLGPRGGDDAAGEKWVKLDKPIPMEIEVVPFPEAFTHRDPVFRAALLEGARHLTAGRLRCLTCDRPLTPRLRATQFGLFTIYDAKTHLLGGFVCRGCDADVPAKVAALVRRDFKARNMVPIHDAGTA